MAPNRSWPRLLMAALALSGCGRTGEILPIATGGDDLGWYTTLALVVADLDGDAIPDVAETEEGWNVLARVFHCR